MTILLDTNVLIRHLTGDPPVPARKARRLLQSGEALLLTDVICAEIVFVLESAYSLPRQEVAALVRTVLGFPTIITKDPELLTQALQLYEINRLDFAEAYLVAVARSEGHPRIASFDRALDRVASLVQRIEEI